MLNFSELAQILFKILITLWSLLVNRRNATHQLQKCVFTICWILYLRTFTDYTFIIKLDNYTFIKLRCFA